MNRSSATHEAKSKAIREIEELGLGYTENAQYDLSQVSVDRRVQVWETAPPPVPERGSESCQHEEIIRICRACGEQL